MDEATEKFWAEYEHVLVQLQTEMPKTFDEIVETIEYTKLNDWPEDFYLSDGTTIKTAEIDATAVATRLLEVMA